MKGGERRKIIPLPLHLTQDSSQVSMNLLITLVFIFFVFLIGLIPFPLLYLFSDFIRFILQRVAGYSDYFNDLGEDLQNEIIERTEHEK